ncbi:ankyrin repeat domain-containing protein [Candidatus Dependentiae bacterium]|nr:ankyrin repeat domain-containing protein [Candidatus Dependentiae bacterium]
MIFKKLFYLKTIFLTLNLFAMESQQERQLPARIRYEVMSYLGPIVLNPKEIEKSLIKSYEQYLNARARAPKEIRGYITNIYRKILLDNLTEEDFQKLNKDLFNHMLQIVQKVVKPERYPEDYLLIELLNLLGKLDINMKDRSNQTMLMLAAREGLENQVRSLINSYVSDIHADIDEKDNLGTTALMWASRYGKDKIAQTLINAGADINEKDFYKDTSLNHAIMQGHKNIVQLLLNKNAKVNEPDDKGERPLTKARDQFEIKGTPAAKEILDLLIAHNATE